MIISVAVKVMIREIWSKMRSEMYVFFRISVSLLRWCWLAIIIKGRSQVVKMSKGEVNGSEANFSEWFWLVISSLFR